METPKTALESIPVQLWEAVKPYLKDGVNEKDVVSSLASVTPAIRGASWVPVTYLHRDDVLCAFGFIEDLDGTLLYSGPEETEETRRAIVEWYVEDEKERGAYLLTQLARTMTAVLLDGMYWEIIVSQLTDAYEDSK